MRATHVLPMLLLGVVTTGRILTADTIAVLPGSGEDHAKQAVPVPRRSSAWTLLTWS